MSALPPKADMAQHDRDVRFVPKADIGLPSLDHFIWRVLTRLAARRNQGFWRYRSQARASLRNRLQDYSITSSACTRNDSGMFRPIAFAAFRFTTNSNLTDICTGRSAGFAPRRIWSM
jgi:hypothetical protein